MRQSDMARHPVSSAAESAASLPRAQGLYDPRFEHDACGIGMIVQTDGEKSHVLVDQAINMLERMAHRGGVGNEADTGDGAGILLQIPHMFLAKAAAYSGFELPEAGDYGVAMLFTSPDEKRADDSVRRFCGLAEADGLTVLGVRPVPVNRQVPGRTAAAFCPGITQVFLARPKGTGEAAFERKLYILGKTAAKAIRHAAEERDPYFYIASLSSRTIVYKGMLLPRQLPRFYLDLLDRDVTSAVALVHSRFSTNTFPSWERAHPMRYIIHNGEINTIGGNAKWVKARESAMASPLFGEDLRRVFPVVEADGSDSAMLDEYLAFLLHAGYSLPQACMTAIPQPYENDPQMDPALRDFYAYTDCLSEPWDGPAAVAFTDGRLAGAMLDRNGLRPARYTRTKDGLLVLASETGVCDIPDADVVEKGRLQPGQMLLVDTGTGRVIPDAEIKGAVAHAHPYGEWLKSGLRTLSGLPQGVPPCPRSLITRLRDKDPAAITPAEQVLLRGYEQEQGEVAEMPLLAKEKLFGYTYEDEVLTLRPMAQKGEDPVSSMGTDTPLAVLSRRPQLLYNYFKQLFAQVTNPPIDAIREHLVTSSTVYLGAEGNPLVPSAENCRRLRHDTPVLLPDEFGRILSLDEPGLRAVTLPALFRVDGRGRGRDIESAMDTLFRAADIAIQGGYSLLVLSDLGATGRLAPIPALLAVSGLHQHLVRQGTRTKASIVVQTGEARETHHVAALVGFGADAVYPALAYEVLDRMAGEGRLSVDAPAARERYRQAVTGSLIKIMSKMGISTVRSYHGAQIFEALGISKRVVDRYFTGTVTRIGGLTLREIEEEVKERHTAAFSSAADEPLDPGGDYKWRRDGEYHLFNPENIYYLQQACRTGDYGLFQRFSACINNRSEQIKNLRGLLRIAERDKPLPLDTVEPVESIVRRFKTGAMSYGSISKEAHECMAIAMNRLGGKSNTGEGGEPEERFIPDENGDSRCSAIKQVASGRFGVTIHYLNNAQEIQIKMAQGAKPGEGGHLPGNKVYPWIAASRHATPGVELISPPPHHDIYSIEDLAQLIHDLKSANPRARISVKLVSGAGVGTIAVGVAKGLADVIVISGYDGGTGAAPRTSIRHAGLPWELGVAEAHQTLLLSGLRNRVVLETDGKLLTGRDIVIAALLGAEEFAFATAPLVVLGCDMMRVCNLDTCPVGIATQNPCLRGRFTGKPEYIQNLMRFLAMEVREWMARIGVTRFDDLVGHAELLRQSDIAFSDKANTVDLSGLLYQPKVTDRAGERTFTQPQQHRLEKTFDTGVLLPLCRDAIETGRPVAHRLGIQNRHRTVGCALSGEIVRQRGSAGLPEGTVTLRFDGSAGQSFGAFCAPGVTLELTGDANDYVGKGLSGGRIIVRPSAGAAFAPEDNVIIGNVAFFGATSGEGFIGGLAGERFGVRNSGAIVVVEGVGDHGCEYMTGGTALILGPVGRNFAAGMTGGIAYVYDPEAGLASKLGSHAVELLPPDDQDAALIRRLMESHLKHTASPLARRLLAAFDPAAFVKAIPTAYRKAQEAYAAAAGEDEEARLLCAYEAVTA